MEEQQDKTAGSLDGRIENIVTTRTIVCFGREGREGEEERQREKTNEDKKIVDVHALKTGRGGGRLNLCRGSRKSSNKSLRKADKKERTT